MNSSKIPAKVPAITLGFWIIKILATTLGETGGDTVSMTMKLGYLTGTAIFLSAFMVLLFFQIRAKQFHPALYWATITFSQTLGTALGDWTADNTDLDYQGAALVFSAVLALVAVLYFRTTISQVFLFWAAFILTRPLGATVGDFLDKPLAQGGLAFSRPLATLVIAVAMIACVCLFRQRPAEQD